MSLNVIIQMKILKMFLNRRKYRWKLKLIQQEFTILVKKQ